MRLINLGLSAGATLVQNTVIALRDGSLVNFLYRIDGLASFATEWRRAEAMTFHGVPLKLVPLERIIRSKEFLSRPKDIAHLTLLRDVLAGRKIVKPRT